MRCITPHFFFHLTLAIFKMLSVRPDLDDHASVRKNSGFIYRWKIERLSLALDDGHADSAASAQNFEYRLTV